MDHHKVEFHDDLERTLAEGDAWYAKFKHQMDDYADRCEPPLPVEQVISKERYWNGPLGLLELNLRDEQIRQSCGPADTPAISRGSSCLFWTGMAILSTYVVSPSRLVCISLVSEERIRLDLPWWPVP